MDRLGVNPIADLPKVKVRGKQKKSRAFTLDELRALCAGVPATRRLAYQVLAWTGQRYSEVKTLVWGDLHLDTAEPHVLVRENATKDATKRAIPLHPSLAAELVTHRTRSVGVDPARANPDKRVFLRFPDYQTLRRDLEKAGIAHRDDTGRVVHFHAFRKTFQTMGVQSGVNQRAAQELLGHSDANLTADAYTDVPALALHREVAKLPWLNGTPFAPSDGHSKSVKTAIPSRFATLCLELVDLVNDFDLERVAKELERKKLASPAGFEPAFSP
ncbi:MAG: tyrosine-type recombinase/integrase [Opitutaceae bacterium]